MCSPEICPEMQAMAKMVILAKFRHAVDEMLSTNKLSHLEGLRKVGEFGESGKNGDSGEISPRFWKEWRVRIN